MNTTQVIVWCVLLVLFIVTEAATAQLVTIWFAFGALVSVIAAVCKAPLWLQIALFTVASVGSLMATRPLVKRVVTAKKQPTNADRCIGKTAIVMEPIDNALGQGQVSVEGATWTARSADYRPISVGDKVKIERIEGVKLIVSPLTPSK